METIIDDLMVKIKAIAQGPNAELLRKLIDILYEREQPQEEYDDEPLSPEELAAIEEADEAKRRGDKDYFIPWEEVKKELGL
ncbi:MAG: hypothetical protein HY790_12070 [Deltaproteobacteria bacterium]|nr:hypothetical protein [Deltaproteobacteria bacterium]MBI4796550.1 hypothetical protein [Deltaproteobacteria bacterium]